LRSVIAMTELAEPMELSKLAKLTSLMKLERLMKLPKLVLPELVGLPWSENVVGRGYDEEEVMQARSNQVRSSQVRRNKDKRRGDGGGTGRE
jgi:hypothetical protein